MLSETDIDKIRSAVFSRKGAAYVILFGSATRRLLSHSDVDLMIGGELSPVEKADLSMELAVELGRQVDIISPEEAPYDVVSRAFSSGIPVLVPDTRIVSRFL
jgi:predicted nucleotidyltransferase